MFKKCKLWKNLIQSLRNKFRHALKIKETPIKYNPTKNTKSINNNNMNNNKNKSNGNNGNNGNNNSNELNRNNIEMYWTLLKSSTEQ